MTEMVVHEREPTETGERRTSRWTTKRIRQAGLAAMVGGALSAVYPVGELVFEFGPPGTPGYETYLQFITPVPVLLVLLLVGVLGLYAYVRDTDTLGRLGRAGVALLVAGYVLEIVGNLVEVWMAGATPAAVLGGNAYLISLFGLLMELVGASLFGVALLRRTAVPRLGAGLLAVALPAGIGGGAALILAGLDEALFFAFMSPIGIGLVVLGYHLRLETNEAIGKLMPVDEREVQAR